VREANTYYTLSSDCCGWKGHCLVGCGLLLVLLGESTVSYSSQKATCDQQQWTDKAGAGRQYLPIPSDFFYNIPRHIMRVNFQKPMSLNREECILYYYYYYYYYYYCCRSQWPLGLRRRSTATRPLRLWVWIPAEAWMFVCWDCCVLSGRGLCDGLVTRPEESYRLWRVVVCDQETSNEEAKARYGVVKNTTKRVVTPRKQTITKNPSEFVGVLEC
jgi:hypothetical protein